MYSFEVIETTKKHQKNAKERKLNAVQNGYLGILIFFYFCPNAKFHFFPKKIKAFKVKTFVVIKKGIYGIMMHTKTCMLRFEAMPLFLSAQ